MTFIEAVLAAHKDEGPFTSWLPFPKKGKLLQILRFTHRNKAKFIVLNEDAVFFLPVIRITTDPDTFLYRELKGELAENIKSISFLR